MGIVRYIYRVDFKKTNDVVLATKKYGDYSQGGELLSVYLTG